MTEPIPTIGTPPDPEWFEEVADHSGQVLFILRVHPDVCLEFVNGGNRTQLVGLPQTDDTAADTAAIIEHLQPDSREAFAAMIAMKPDTEMTVELAWRHVTGRRIDTRGWVRCRERANGSVVVEGSLRDITPLHDVERELRNSEQRHRLLAQNAWDVIWTMGLDGSITYVSPAVERVRGFTPEEAMTQTLEEIHPPETAAKVGKYFADLFAAIADGIEIPVYRAEHEYYRKDGSIMTGELQVIPHVDVDGNVVEILGVTRDISERKRFEAELTRLAITDPLTGLWNRRHTGELLAADLEQAERHAQPLTLLMVDIDHFKSINDTHGHQTGDLVLIEVAHRLLESIRTTDVVGRWGGEEFVILLRYCSLPDGIAIAEKLRRRIADTPIGPLMSVSVSIGVAAMQADDDLTSWLAQADSALYEAKRAGRNAVAAG